MNIVKQYKKSVRFLCGKCGYPTLAANVSECTIRERCSPCIEGTRGNHRMDWAKWRKGMRRAKR